MGSGRWLSVIVVLAGGAVLEAAAPQTWDFRDGQWVQVDAPATRPADSQAAPAKDPTLDRAEALLQGNRNKQALKVLIRWLKSKPDTQPFRDRALFLTS